MGKKGLEPLTLRLSSVYSNQLSYLPQSGVYKQNTWERQDSNLRRPCQQIYSLPPLTAQPLSHVTPNTVIPDVFSGRDSHYVALEYAHEFPQ